ncbi:hypothetical protein NG798_15820 [Ancylothrix sp. C2]|uniref:hypothetical protein n=1 Tax=Ancylothrix sp. D3o TaxID=2953691 RepID=UPI0021BAFEE3|nr:hypothetical protein [Ancylothrix sp. D3o]MCT7951268.1 hypothetical protein [Ancylothrix sp. D3o]
MESPSIINQVVNNLQQHPESVRIKKIIFLAAKKVWIQDINKLEELNFSGVFQELISANRTRESLREVLYRAAGTLNKKAEYVGISNTILSLVGPVFTEAVTANQSPTVSQDGVPKPASIPPKISSFPKDKNDLFDIKLDILRYTNPLRAKILIFSTLYHQFRYTEDELSLLKRHEIDDLIIRLYRACPTLPQLKNKLDKTAKSLPSSSENIQAAETIFMALRGYYTEVKEEDLKETESSASQPNSSNNQATNWVGEDDDDEDETCQLTTS